MHGRRLSSPRQPSPGTAAETQAAECTSSVCACDYSSRAVATPLHSQHASQALSSTGPRAAFCRTGCSTLQLRSWELTAEVLHHRITSTLEAVLYLAELLLATLKHCLASITLIIITMDNYATTEVHSLQLESIKRAS